MNVSRAELLERLYFLMNRVARIIVSFPENPADCFCSSQHEKWPFLYDVRILEFVEKVINDKLDEIEVV